MPGVSISVFVLVSGLFALTAAAPAPAPEIWNLASPDAVIRVVRVIPKNVATAPELGGDLPATLSVVALEEGRQAWIWEIPRGATRNGFALEGERFEATSDVICFGCTETDRTALAHVIGKPKAAGRAPKDILPLSPITLVISDSRVFPNPFNPFVEDAEISVTLSEAAELQITAYDWNGDFVATVFKELVVVPAFRTLWSGQTQDGRKLGNGVYFLRVVAKSGTRQEEQVIKVAVWNER